MDEFTPLPLIPEKQAADDSWPPPPPPGGGTPSTPSRHRKNSSSLSDLSMLEVDRTGDDVELVVREIVVATPERTHHHHKDGSTMDNNNVPQPQSVPIPVSTLIVVTDSAQLQPEDASSSSFANMNMSASSPENGGATPTAATKNSDGLLTNKPSHHELLRRQSSSSFPNILHDMIHHATAGSFGEHHTTCDVKDFTLTEKQFRVRNWDGVQGYSDYIQQGLQFKKEQHQQKQQQQQQLALEPPTNGHGNMEIAQTTGITGTSTATTGSKGIINDNNSNNNVVMLFESPSSCTADFAFYNGTKFRFHDWPPPSKTGGKSVLGPCRYALMNGDAYPVFLKDGTPPAGLLDHWRAAVPGFVPPRYVDKITDAETVYAYLPVEQIRSHVNDPDVHYHLAGKDAIHLMTQKTTALLPDTKSVRPCVVKTTHSMGSKGIFIIQNDDDEREFEQFLEDSGHPTYVVTNFVDIARNVACHFFMHPNGSVVWFGSNENHREADGSFSSDSYLIMEHQDKLKELQLPFVEEVVQYCHGLGFFGFCGVDVLFDSKDRGYLVDINPRVTGSCPALMTLKRLSDKYSFTVGLFRRSGKTAFHGSPADLLAQVAAYNEEHEGKSRVVIHSLFQTPGTTYTRINIGVYGTNLNECKTVLNSFAKGTPEQAKKE